MILTPSLTTLVSLSVCLLCACASEIADDVRQVSSRSHGLRFLNPSLVNGAASYTVGQHVNISWTTNFAHTNLRFYQQRSNSLYSITLANDYDREHTTYTWRAAAIDSSSMTGTYYFQLENAVDPSCHGCQLNSASFVLAPRSSGSSTSSGASPSPTPSASQTTQRTSSRTTSAAEQSSSAATGSADPKSSSSSNGDDLGIGLGVGLGVGIPFVAVIAILFFLLYRKRRKTQTQEEDAAESYEANETEMREGSGSPDQRPFTPSMPRPSYAGMSEFSGTSNQSWFEPFEFERPQMRDRDAISQLRQSIYSHGSVRDSSDLASIRGTDLSSLGGIPNSPPPTSRGTEGP